MSLETDNQLVDHINQGNLEAFETLYHRHRDWICQLAYRFTCDRDLSLDVLQETFAYLLKKFPGFQLSCQMRTFLYPVVKHISLEIIRKRRMNTLPDDHLADLPAAPEVPADSTKSDLASIMSNLPAAQREVLLMRLMDEMSIDEIATALEIPPGTVKSRVHNALQTLRRDKKTKHYFFG